MIVHEVRVLIPTRMGGLDVQVETAVYLETQAAVRQFRKVAEERGWKAGEPRTYIAGTVEQAVAEVEREIALSGQYAGEQA